MNADDEGFRENLTRQLAMNKTGWQRLLASGYTEGKPVRLEFSYYAPDEERAGKLREYLERETGCEVRVSFEEIEWCVNGVTGEVMISSALLDSWVEWMVAAGHRFEAQFDGWICRFQPGSSN